MDCYEFVAYTDGACTRKHGDPLGSAAFIICDQNGEIVAINIEEVNINATNNVCEYKGLLLLLNFLEKRK